MKITAETLNQLLSRPLDKRAAKSIASKLPHAFNQVETKMVKSEAWYLILHNAKRDDQDRILNFLSQHANIELLEFLIIGEAKDFFREHLNSGGNQPFQNPFAFYPETELAVKLFKKFLEKESRNEHVFQDDPVLDFCDLLDVSLRDYFVQVNALFSQGPSTPQRNARFSILLAKTANGILSHLQCLPIFIRNFIVRFTSDMKKSFQCEESEILPFIHALLMVHFICPYLLTKTDKKDRIKTQYLVQLLLLIGNGQQAYRDMTTPMSLKYFYNQLYLEEYIYANFELYKQCLLDMQFPFQFMEPDESSMLQIFSASHTDHVPVFEPGFHVSEVSPFVIPEKQQEAVVSKRHRSLVGRVTFSFLGTAIILGAGVTLWPFLAGASASTWIGAWVPVLSALGLAGTIGVVGGIGLAVAVIVGIYVGYRTVRANWLDVYRQPQSCCDGEWPDVPKRNPIPIHTKRCQRVFLPSSSSANTPSPMVYTDGQNAKFGESHVLH